MARRFSKKQREALFNWTLGRCSICGSPLKDGWHADHKVPFSKSGQTDVINGQALCPSCNLKKGTK